MLAKDDVFMLKSVLSTFSIVFVTILSIDFSPLLVEIPLMLNAFASLLYSSSTTILLLSGGLLESRSSVFNCSCRIFPIFVKYRFAEVFVK